MFDSVERRPLRANPDRLLAAVYAVSAIVSVLALVIDWMVTRSFRSAAIVIAPMMGAMSLLTRLSIDDEWSDRRRRRLRMAGVGVSVVIGVVFIVTSRNWWQGHGDIRMPLLSLLCLALSQFTRGSSKPRHDSHEVPVRTFSGTQRISKTR
jgi:hypothetical protein